MANNKSNFPSGQISRLAEENPNYCSVVVESLRELAINGKPKTIEQLEQRLDMYFEFCAKNDFRVGIESLSLALGCTRKTFWNWCNGIGVTKEFSERCALARQFVIAFLEQATMQGKLNPASSIFYLKNWADYKDNAEVQEVHETRQKMSLAQLQEIVVDEVEN